MIKDFLKNSAIYGAGKFIALLLGFLTLPIITRTLSPDDYGVFDLLNLALILLNLSVAMEISQAVARFIADQKNTADKQSYVSTAYFFSLLMYGITALLVWVLRDDIARWIFGDGARSDLVLYLLPWLFLHGSFTFIVNQFRWENKPKQHVILQVIQGGLLLSFVGYFLLYQAPTLSGLITAYLCALSISVAIGFFFIISHRIMRFTFSKARLKEMIYFSLPLVPSSLAVFGQNYIDRIMISQMIDLQSLGVYSLAFKVASLLAIFSSIFQLSIVPLIYKHHGDEDAGTRFGESARLYLFFILSCILGLSIFTPELFTLFIGEAFYGAIAIVPILLIAIGFQSFYIFAPGLAIVKKTYYIALINAVGFALNLGLNYIFILRYGLIGAAIATTITAVIICVINIKISQKHYVIAYDYSKILMATAITLIGVGAVYIWAPQISITTITIKLAALLSLSGIAGYILLGSLAKDYLASRKL